MSRGISISLKDRANAVRALQAGKRTRIELAAQFDVHPDTIGKWARSQRVLEALNVLDDDHQFTLDSTPGTPTISETALTDPDCRIMIQFMRRHTMPIDQRRHRDEEP